MYVYAGDSRRPRAGAVDQNAITSPPALSGTRYVGHLPAGLHAHLRGRVGWPLPDYYHHPRCQRGVFIWCVSYTSVLVVKAALQHWHKPFSLGIDAKRFRLASTVERRCNLYLLLAVQMTFSCHACHMPYTHESLLAVICPSAPSISQSAILFSPSLPLLFTLLPCYIIMSLSSIYAEPSRYHHRRNIGTCTLHSSSSDRRQNGGPENICQNWWDPKTCLEHCAIYIHSLYSTSSTTHCKGKASYMP